MQSTFILQEYILSFTYPFEYSATFLLGSRTSTISLIHEE